jgi:hypothetical protein
MWCFKITIILFPLIFLFAQEQDRILFQHRLHLDDIDLKCDKCHIDINNTDGNNFITKSEKGKDYIASYYALSEYGINNHIVSKHSLEHLSLMNSGIKIWYELQYGNNDNKIIINKSTYDDLKNIFKIYSDSENHKEIDVVLDYLKTDLEKYYNKTKAEIATDFR